MASSSISRGILRDVIIIAVGIAAIWAGLYVVFGMANPFFVVASGSMVPELEVYDVLVVQRNIPFGELKVGDIIVFDRPSDHNRVIVHRIVSIVDEDPRTIRTKGDANRASIPGTDFPVTNAEYIGKVEIVIPQVGYVTQALKPPVNYIIIAVIIGAMVAKQIMARKKSEQEGSSVEFSETSKDVAAADYDDDKENAPADNAQRPAQASDMPAEHIDEDRVDDSAYVTADDVALDQKDEHNVTDDDNGDGSDKGDSDSSNDGAADANKPEKDDAG